VRGLKGQEIEVPPDKVWAFTDLLVEPGPNDGFYEWLRKKAEALTKPKPSGPPPRICAKGSMEWQAQREALKRNS
jgi:hypothetical protein